MAVEWLGNRATALGVITFALGWQGLGWQALIVLGGMMSIDPAVLDAVEIDGSRFWRKMFAIVMPMLVHTVGYSVVVNVIWVFTRLFPFIYSITGGGPGYETTTIDYMIYVKAFASQSWFGYASAIAVLLLFIVMIITWFEIRIANRTDDWS